MSGKTHSQQLGNNEVAQILLLIDRHVKQKNIAARFRVTPSLISKISARQTHKNISKSIDISPAYQYLLSSPKYIHSLPSSKEISQLKCLLHHGVKQNIISGRFHICSSYVSKISKEIVYKEISPASTIDPVYRDLLNSSQNITALYPKEKVSQIKALLNHRVPQKYIARRFGVSDSHVNKIFKRVLYGDIRPSNKIDLQYEDLLHISINHIRHK